MSNSKSLESSITFRLIPEKWVSNGFTLGHYQGKTVFLTGGIPGKEDNFFVEKENSRIIYARAVEVETDCEAFPVCGGCSYRHIPYEEEIEIKKRELVSAFKQNVSIEIKILTGNTSHYRNNVQWKMSGERIGFHSRFSNHVVDLRKIGCKNLDPLLEFPQKGSKLDLRISNEEVIDYKNSETRFYVGEKNFVIPPGGFQQINSSFIPKWIEYIHNKIITLLPMGKKIDCLELFCGSGIIGQSVSECFNSLYGIEGAKQSIASARQNAQTNQLNQFTYKVLDLYKSLIDTKIPKYPLWIINPPRSGAGKEVIQLWRDHKPDLVIYSSCDAQTLARDWKMIDEATDLYNIESLCLMDFFPRTNHFETVAVFVKKDFQEKAIQ